MSKLMLKEMPKQIAKRLLEIDAVALRPNDPFTWTSGIKSPIYCDNRLTMSYPEIREIIADAFVTTIRERFPDTEVIAGTSTAGIPHAAWVAQKMNLPMAYIRDKAKGHGKENKIEGRIHKGQKVIVIEDLISTGGSSLKAAQSVEEVGGEVQAVLAIFTYQFEQANRAFKEADITLATLSNYSALIEEALELGVIQGAEVEALQAWSRDPKSYV